MILLEGRFGIEKSKNRAREIMFWPGMSKSVEKMVSECEVCQKFQRANIKEPLLAHEVPKRPFEKIGMDIMTYKSVDYLSCVTFQN
ncbi:uncharacterized protein K02A2.6 [Nephila pilipes]|uniref:RNA-directed DNA polymerase n=1 Tax=Nephila pilipes TaxID=299642 RepID=A0A8X6QYR4_NEPPI|nr:uncharacterized protein K02A2.6 [Nephila pilipes]